MTSDAPADNPLSRISSNDGVDKEDSRARINNDRQRRRSRSRSPLRRGDRGDGGGGGGRRSAGGRGGGGDMENLVSVSNIPFEVRWMELKDLLREKAGETNFVEILELRDGRSKGSAIVQFKRAIDLDKCLQTELMMGSRNLKVTAIRDPVAFLRRIKEETGKDFFAGGGERTGGRGGGSGGGGGGRGSMGGRREGGRALATGTYETYGLSPTFLTTLGIDGPLCSRVFVANIAYEQSSGKVMDIFSMAGRVTWIDLHVDKDGKNKGMAVVEYSHPLEAVQAISMFDKQTFFERRLGVKMDRFEAEHVRPRHGQLPDGLRSVGTGLGANGAPLENIGSMIVQSGLGTNPMAAMMQPQTPQNMAPQQQQQPMAQQQQPQQQQQQLMSTPGGAHNSFAQSGAMYASSIAASPQQQQQGGYQQQQQQPQQQHQLPMNPLMDNSRGFGQMGNQQQQGQYGGSPQVQQQQQQPQYNQPIQHQQQPQQQQAPQQPAPPMVPPTTGGYGGGSTSLNRDIYGAQNQSYDQGQGGGGFGGGNNDVKPFGSGGDQGARGPSNANEQISRTLVIRNLPVDYTWQMVKERLQRMGDVEFCNIREAGIARVTFRNADAAEKVFAALQGSIVEGRTINVVYA